MQAVDLILLLFSVNYNLDWDYVGSSSAEKSTSDPLLVKIMSSFDLPEDCTFPQQSKMTSDVEAEEPKLITSCPKTILHQIMLCCQLVKEADDDEGKFAKSSLIFACNNLNRYYPCSTAQTIKTSQ